LGLADSYGLAFFKAQEATQQTLPAKGTVLITVADADKPSIVDTAKAFGKLGFKIKATEDTLRYLTEKGIKAEHILKVYEGRPNIVDAIKNNEIQLIINTPIGKQSQHDDSYIRKAAIKYKVPYITTTTAAAATAKGIAARKDKEASVKSLQDYHAGIE
jgi:carbamoyl-phosphate synthase large subunit